MIYQSAECGIQGKFTLKNDDYREVRSLRLTDDTWKQLGIVSECSGLTRADYLEEIIKKQFYPCNTRQNQGDIQFFTLAELEPQLSIKELFVIFQELVSSGVRG
ncbi:hypothetical protein [Fortiea contorta]|uniref:hypothetical protein n=1 Tax=Fortiea contorta TaxID=1892405 RepID=UPI0003467434|nr:hypothetical protein [Fortiea contorta]